MIDNLIYNKYYFYFKNKLKIKIMLHKIKIDNLENIMKNLNFKNNTDEYNDINRKLDNLLLKYIKNDITLDQQDYNFLSNNHIDKNFIENRVKNLKLNTQKLKILLDYPLIEQRTKEWFDKRKKCLTASDLLEGISKNNKLLAKKKQEYILIIQILLIFPH